jgi:UPF0176 protein
MQPTAAPVLNAACYRFVDLAPGLDGEAALAALAPLRRAVHERAQALGLAGTVLLAPEGINLFVAGRPEDVGEFLGWLQADARFAALDVKTSGSRSVPFGRLKVKIKREIIRLDRPDLRPAAGRAPAVDARTLARWLDGGGRDDDGRPVRLLDTRNAFEFDYGSFEQAEHLGLARFTEFAPAIDQLGDDWRDARVVSFCTGGIRCEKAALLLRAQGFEHAVQLEGGILRYFEEVGGAHYRGRCFVFDGRVALDARLEPQAG